MKKCLLSCIFFTYLFHLQGQIGFTVSPTSTFAPDWQVIVENFATHERTDFLRYGATGVIDYTFQKPGSSLRIQPALHAMRTSIDYVPHHFDIYSLGIQSNISVAPFQNGRVTSKPVFYLQVSPGISYVHTTYKMPVLEGGAFAGKYDMLEGSDLAPNIGINLFMEWQLTSLLSLSPMAGMRYFPSVEWPGFTEHFSDGALVRSHDRTYWRQLSFGLRIGLNFSDEGNEKAGG